MIIGNMHWPGSYLLHEAMLDWNDKFSLAMESGGFRKMLISHKYTYDYVGRGNANEASYIYR